MKFSFRGLIPLFLFLCLALYFAVGLTKDPSVIPSELIDRPVPDFALTDLYDETKLLTRQDLLGEVTLLNIFGSWCVACVQEHPTLVELSKSEDIRIIGVDWRDTRPKAKAWLTRYGDPYTRIIFDGDSTMAVDLGVTGAPETFIVDKAGQIRYKYTGVITPDIWDQTLKPVVDILQAQGIAQDERAAP